MNPCLELRNVHLAYGSTDIIRHASFALARGEILSLLGPSGGGKSTLLRAIAGLLPVKSGEIVMQGATVSSPAVHLVPQRRQVGMIFQDYALFPHLDVLGNIAFGIEHLRKAERMARAREMMRVVQLDGLEKRYPHQLSGGQQQRVAIARALVREPACLLLDEPFSNLDNAVREALMDDMQRLFRARGISAIFVTHNKAEAFALADRVAVLQAGEIGQMDTPTALYDHPANDDIAAFLGHGATLRFAKEGDGWANSAGRIPFAARAQVMLRGESGEHADIFLRPHQLILRRDAGGNGEVEQARFLGDFSLYRVRLDDQRADVLCKNRLQVGDRVQLGIDIRG
ncbi:MAG: ABC transporter ATP-binding protein [Cardiobacteriaceae bacterium]|nr:ABC transporter ATP-binding protein [Cardiobacteriaceae bacterium]